MTRKLRIENETQHDGRQVGACVRWAFRELGLSGDRVVVKVKYHRGSHAYQGRIYYNAHSNNGWVWSESRGDYIEVAPNIPADYNSLIICRLAKTGYPIETHVYDRRDSPGTWVVNDWREALVAVTAHEAMHLRQHLTKKRGAKGGRKNEVETEWAAYRLWKRWCDR
jgi:hypothetical protein